MVMDLKPIIFMEAVDFLKSKVQKVSQHLTNSHHNIINDYLKLRKDYQQVCREKDYL